MLEREKKINTPDYDSLVGGKVLVPDHIKKITDLVAVGRDKEKIAIGFHGTSLAALGVAMKTGYIPTGRSENCEGHLYFFPTSHAPVNREGLKPSNNSQEPPAEKDKNAFEASAGYAHDLSRAALAAHSLGLNLADGLDWEISLNVGGIACGQAEPTPGTVDEKADRIKERLKDKGISKRDLSRLAAQLEKTEFDRGFVLLIGESALKAHSHHLGDPGHGDLKLNLPPEGLSLEHLVGIEPISDADFKVIKKLQEKYWLG